MKLQTSSSLEVPSDLLDAIRAFPTQREVEHCGTKFRVSPLAIYAVCPSCGVRIKVRSYSGVSEVEDIFDAVLEWMGQPEARDHAQRRQEEIEADRNE